MGKLRHTYGTNLADRKRAIQNLQFALEDKTPWFMNTKFKPNETALAKGKFANWITRENFDLACKAIINATDPIYFYQFDDMPEASDEQLNMLMNWKDDSCRAGHSLIL
jgi:hypothetical protein